MVNQSQLKSPRANIARSSASCCGHAAVVQTPSKSAGKSPRSRQRRMTTRQSGDAHKQLMLEPSAPAHVCNCTELLKRLETTINDPPPLADFDPAEVRDNCASSSVRQRSPRKESIFLLKSTASFDEAIVIESDDSDDEALRSESEPAESSQALGFQMPQNGMLTYDEESQSPKKPLDFLDEPVNIAIKVSLPLPKKLSTRLSSESSWQSSKTKKFCSSRASLKSKGRRSNVVDTESSDVQMSACNSGVLASTFVGSETTDIELDMSVESLPFLSAGAAEECSQISDEADETQNFVDNRLPSLVVGSDVEPDDGSASRLTDDASRSSEQEVRLIKPVVCAAEKPLELVPAENLPRGQDIKTVSHTCPNKTGTLAELEENKSSQNSAAVVNGVVVETEVYTVLERTLTETDTSASDKTRSSINASTDDTEIYFSKDCRLPPALESAPPAQPTADTEIRLPEYANIGSSVVSEPDLTVAHVDHSEVFEESFVTLRVPKKNKSSRLSPPRGSNAVNTTARKIKKAAVSRQIGKQRTSVSQRKRFKKFTETSEGCRAPDKQLKMDERTVLSGIDDRILSDRIVENTNRSPVDDLSVQKDAEVQHVSTGAEHRTVDSDPLHPDDRLVTSPCHTSSSVAELKKKIKKAAVNRQTGKQRTSASQQKRFRKSTETSKGCRAPDKQLKMEERIVSSGTDDRILSDRIVENTNRSPVDDLSAQKDAEVRHVSTGAEHRTVDSDPLHPDDRLVTSPCHTSSSVTELEQPNLTARKIKKSRQIAKQRTSMSQCKRFRKSTEPSEGCREPDKQLKMDERTVSSGTADRILSDQIVENTNRSPVYDLSVQKDAEVQRVLSNAEHRTIDSDPLHPDDRLATSPCHASSSVTELKKEIKKAAVSRQIAKQRTSMSQCKRFRKSTEPSEGCRELDKQLKMDERIVSSGTDDRILSDRIVENTNRSPVDDLSAQKDAEVRHVLNDDEHRTVDSDPLHPDDRLATSPCHASSSVTELKKKIKKAAVNRQTGKQRTSASQQKRFRKSTETSEGCRAPDKQLKMEERIVSSGTDDRILSDRIVENTNRSPVDDLSAQKDAEVRHVLNDDEHRAIDSDPLHPDDRLATSPCHASSSVTELEETLVEDRPENSQVVISKPSNSPLHMEDREVAEFSVTSTESVSSPPYPDWIQARSSGQEAATRSHLELRNRLAGMDASVRYLSFVLCCVSKKV